MQPGEGTLEELVCQTEVEIKNADGKMLGPHGLIEILKSQDYPRSHLSMEALEEALLKYSNSIRMEDDLTIIEIRSNRV